MTTEGQRAQQDKPAPKKGAAATAPPEEEDLFATPSTVNSKPAVEDDSDSLPF